MQTIVRLGLVLALACFAAAPLARADESQYARPELLVEADELVELAKQPKFVLLDARPAADYAVGHLAGARSVDAAAWAKQFGDGSDADAWSRRIADLGIDRDSTVVIYDAASSKDAARIWWILRYWGVEDARLLNGGFELWQSAGRPLTTETPPATRASGFRAEPRAERLVTKEELLAAIKQGTLQIIDARSHQEHCGLEALTNRRAGAIPSAKNLDWVELIDPETKRFKPAVEIAPLFEAAGIDLAKPTAAHCQSGGRSSVMVFALELMGAETAGNYYASWAEWGSADDTPIVQPPAEPQK